MNEFETINECGQVPSAISPAHSKGKPAVPPTTHNINVRFAALSPVPIPIRHQIRLTVSGQTSLPIWLMTGPSAATSGNL
jgi:hypothetical protein